ncbi:MAG: TIGR03808 family TAT-translocated repetitive protein, partial [Xanthobacteraceae bacterium]|nr:TIGR03808 family TAT-translocated repetitive protein [Xanthobacteraceae bacterium]
DQGGRLAVCQGNLVRNLNRGDPKHRRGIGIAIEADSAVTGNVIEGAPMAGILVGSGKYLRDVTVTGNVVRTSPIGIAVSVAPDAGSALVADNLIAGATTGAVVGMEDGKAVTGDLAREDGSRFAQLTITGNRVR